MSFLGKRLAGKEGAYFFHESKQAVARLTLTQKNTPTQQPPPHDETHADVLPEVLRHSLPSKIFSQHSDPHPSSLSHASKWLLQSDPSNKPFSSASLDALNPLRAYVSLPQVTFGPKRWQLPEGNHLVSASTANELRCRSNYTYANPQKLRAAAEGLSQIGKAFAVATAIVFGGATLMFWMAASKLELHNSDDIRTKGRDLVHPKFEMVKEQLVPLKTWGENISKKWHLERDEGFNEKPIIVKELSKILGPRTST